LVEQVRPASRTAFQNGRADYVNAVPDKLINWSFAADNLG
jgi:superoxide dismutase